MHFSSQHKKLLLLVVFGITGLVLAAYTGRFFLSRIPSDFTRTKGLLHFLEEDASDKGILMLGNSVAMDGFNARLFSRFSCVPKAYNLSSPGQNQLETILLLSSIKSKPETILHLMNTMELDKPDYLTNQVVYNFLLFGYSINDFAQSSLQQSRSAQQIPLFYSSEFKIAFESRWLITNYLNTKFRSVLRKDLSLDNLVTELYYPRNYTDKFSEEKLQPLISLFNPKMPVTSFSIDTTKLKLLEKTGNYLKTKGIRYVVVLSPLNPRLNNFRKEYFEGMEKYFQVNNVPNVEFVNISTLLTEEEFVDHIHPSHEGARKISLHLANFLSKCSSKP